MQPETINKWDEKSFERLKRNVKHRVQALRERKNNPAYSKELPDDIGMQINRNCNLRCKICFLWNEDGRYKYLTADEKKTELDVVYFDKILKETSEAKSNIFIWGTEPFFHSQWDDYARCLEKDPRWLVICTNGILIKEKLHTILPISNNTVLDVSMDGLEEQHDAIRGKGNFKKTMDNIKLVLNLQKTGEYKGLVSIHCVVTEQVVPNMYEIASYVESLGGIDTLYFGLPWYISPETACEMDNYFNQNIPIDLKTEGSNKPSWHHYAYHIQKDLIEELRNQLDKLRTKKWNFRFRLQPNIEMDTLEDFILGGKIPAQNKTKCLATSNRMDVLASGDITACQCFPEFAVGNVKNNSVKEIWKGEQYNKVREVINNGLTPICSKCILLYLNGV